jgi:glyoxalase family protein
MNAVSGLHHVTAIAADPQRNLDFYAGVLGLRLVKRTVNFDDPQTYHLYYGDESGTPGSLLTFFPWPGARRGRHGAGQVAITTFAIPPDAVGFWIERLLRHNISYIGPTRRVTAGATARETESAISFRDPDGMMLELVGRPGAAARPAWNGAPGIPAEAAVRGLDGVTLWVEDSDPTGRVLTDLLGMRVAGREGSTLRLTGKDHESIPTVVTVRAVPGFTRAAGGAGTVHHVAFAVSDQAAQLELRERLSAAALSPTSVIDRRYFHSVYFREPEGVLFELATTGPGMTVDEPLEQLGERLMLPPQYEPSRSEIEAALPRIHLPMPPPAATVFAEARARRT